MKGKIRSAIALTLSAALLSANMMTFAAPVTFSDVKTGYWAYSYISRAAEEGLVNGYDDGTYKGETTLEAAHFVTMICNLFYKDDVAKLTGTAGKAWWYPYMTVAYSKGILANTVAGDARKAASDWTAAMASAPINRYDMAQIMANIITQQGWQAPSMYDIAVAKSKIGDMSIIPTKYQNAVAIAYAKGFLSGKDTAGTFAGADSIKRCEAAVVLCKLSDAKNNNVVTNEYTNTTKLVNGRTANVANVQSALLALKKDYPEGDTWSYTSSYTSKVLGAGFGSGGFAYMLSDAVFGTMKSATITKGSQVRPGDVLYYSPISQYVIVTEVTSTSFSYATSIGLGVITWTGSAKLNTLTNKETIYTRYPDSTATLTDGSEVKERNVSDLLDDLMSEYSSGTAWNSRETYDSNELGDASGDQAFTYMISDEIFGDLTATEHNDFDELRVGDIVYIKSDDIYVVVIGVGSNSFSYGSAVTGKVRWNGSMKFSETTSKDFIITRYTDAPSKNSTANKLANGDNPTVKNVQALLDDLMENYAQRDTWAKSKSYTSSILGKGTGDKGFAYMISDEIFGDMDVVEHTDGKAIQVGDVVYLDDDGIYGIVISKTSTKFVYGSTESGRIYWDYEMNIRDLDSDDAIYTRYLDSEANTSDKLADGSKVTTDNVQALLDEMMYAYDDGDSWSLSKSYTSSELGKATGNKAFVYKISDEIFGDLPMSKISKSDLQIGDIIYLDDEEIYAIVTGVSTTRFTYGSTDGKIYWDGSMRLGELTSADTIYSRYPDGKTDSSSDTLANGKDVTLANVKSLLSSLMTKYADDYVWTDRKSYTSNVLKKATGSGGFAYMISDGIFGDLDAEEHSDFNELQVGDIVYFAEDDIYVVVTAVGAKTFTFGSSEGGKVYWGDSINYSQMGKNDIIITRYT